MQIINSETGLRDAILQLESNRAEEGGMLKREFHLAYESIRPINLLKSTFKEAAASQDLKDNILNTVVGLTAGYLSKRLIEGEKSSPLKKFFGTALMFGITNLIVKNPEAVQTFGMKLFKIMSGAEGDSVNEVDNSETGEAASSD